MRYRRLTDRGVCPARYMADGRAYWVVFPYCRDITLADNDIIGPCGHTCGNGPENAPVVDRRLGLHLRSGAWSRERATMAAEGSDRLSLLGAALAVFAVITLVAALVVSLRTYWTRIAVRVAGSWIAAIGLLMLGWLVRGLG